MAQATHNRHGGLLARLGFGGQRRVVLAIAAFIAIGAVVGVVALGARAGFEVERRASTTQATPQSQAATQAATTAEKRTVVHVDGAVTSPGVYEIVGDSVRVRDAVAAAGGLANDADTSSVNLAAALVDGSKVHIPSTSEKVTTSGASSSGSTSGSTSSSGSSSGSSPSESSPVNINTADQAALETLPGIGAATAQTILKDREKNGPFSSVDDLMRVTGIGEKKLERVRGLICV